MQANDGEHWFVACVKPSHERVAARVLGNCGYECWVPLQRVRRKWSDRIKVVEQLVLPHMLFVRTDESGRIRSLKEVGQVSRYLYDHASKRPAIIPDGQLELFRKMVGQSSLPVGFTASELAPGDAVEIVDGPLAGNICELVNFNGAKRVAVRLDMLGAAMVELPLSSLRKLP